MTEIDTSLTTDKFELIWNLLEKPWKCLYDESIRIKIEWNYSKHFKVIVSLTRKIFNNLIKFVFSEKQSLKTFLYDSQWIAPIKILEDTRKEMLGDVRRVNGKVIWKGA